MKFRSAVALLICAGLFALPHAALLKSQTAGFLSTKGAPEQEAKNATPIYPKVQEEEPLMSAEEPLKSAAEPLTAAEENKKAAEKELQKKAPLFFEVPFLPPSPQRRQRLSLRQPMRLPWREAQASVTMHASQSESHAKSHTHTHKQTITHQDSSKVIWFLGNSIDSRMLIQACQRAGAPLVQDTSQCTHIDQSFKYCKIGSLTLVYSFHPGANPPPYFPLYIADGQCQINRTTADIVTSHAKDIELIFGKPPDATIVDSSLWDLGSLWQYPVKNSPATPEEIVVWWNHTIPTFLASVQSVVPHSRIAFRTTVPVKPNPFSMSGELNEEMYKGLLKSVVAPSNLLYGKWHLLDLFKVAVSFGTGPALWAFYTDVVHPGPLIMTAFMDAVLAWVATSLHSDDTSLLT